MAKVTEKDVIRILEELVEKLGNKIKKTEAALHAIEDSDEKVKLTRKNRKVIKDAETEIKKSHKKKNKTKASNRPIDLTTTLKHILPAEEVK